jgi:hypothetical protein
MCVAAVVLPSEMQANNVVARTKISGRLSRKRAGHGLEFAQ